MKKFRNKKTGEIATYKDGCFKKGNCVVEIGVEPSSEFWEEIIEKDYEILSFRTNKQILLIPEYVILNKEKDNIFRNHTACIFTISSSEDKLLNSSNYNIHSVKRLSDGEIFTIGDSIKGKSGVVCKIHSIDLNPNYSQILFNKLDEGIDLINAKHIKTPLFITEDRVDIFQGDMVTPVHAESLKIYATTPINTGESIKYGNYKYFSTKEAAEEYILMNKPCLSINDVNNCYTSPMPSPLHNKLVENLKQLVKSKFNNKKEIW